MGAPCDSNYACTTGKCSSLSDLRHPGLCSGNLLRWILIVFELTRKISIVSRHIEMSMTAKIEEDHALLACLFRGFRLLQDGTDRMGCFRGRNNTLRASKQLGSTKHANLAIRLCFHKPLVSQQAHHRHP